jgi:hypothetical protein
VRGAAAAVPAIAAAEIARSDLRDIALDVVIGGLLGMVFD